MSENTVQTDRQNTDINIAGHRRFECWINKTIGTHKHTNSEYNIILTLILLTWRIG